MELLQLLNPAEIVVQLVSFLILLVLLRVFAWKRILGIIEKRREAIAAELQRIESAKADVARLKNDYEEHLRTISQQAQERIKGAVEDGRKLADEIRKSAHLQAQDIVDGARRNVAYELKKAQDEVKDKIIDLALGAAETVIREKFTEERDRKIVEEFIDSIDKAE
jgi:F-type H+-transporting ATPase subunit b